MPGPKSLSLLKCTTTPLEDIQHWATKALGILKNAITKISTLTCNKTVRQKGTTPGYSYPIEVDVNGQLVKFEPDEEKIFRALFDAEQIQKGVKINTELLAAIAKVLESVSK